MGKSSEGSGSKTLGKIAGQINKETGPVRKEWLSQLFQVLKGGTAASTLPVAQNMTTASQQAGSRASQQTTEQLARMGLSGTPFAARAQAEQTLSNRQSTAQIPGQVAEMFLGQVPGAALGLTNSSISAASGQAQAQGQSGAGKMSALGSLGQGAGQMGAAKKAAKVAAPLLPFVGCWIAAALYGLDTYEFFAARRFIFDCWQGPIATTTRWLYLKFGPRVGAAIAQKTLFGNLAAWVLRPLFDIAVRKGA